MAWSSRRPANSQHFVSGATAASRVSRNSSKGYAERIEYDEREDTVKLITRARVRLLENEVQRDELRGDAITYDQRNAKYFVTGGKPSADPSNPDGRVRGTIAPRADTPAGTSKAGKAPLRRPRTSPTRVASGMKVHGRGSDRRQRGAGDTRRAQHAGGRKSAEEIWQPHRRQRRLA